MKTLRTLIVVVFVLFSSSSVFAEDVILQGNRVVMATLAVPGQQPPTVFGGRTTSMMHLAMFDAVNSIDGIHGLSR